jgi:hypothetical protein
VLKYTEFTELRDKMTITDCTVVSEYFTDVPKVWRNSFEIVLSIINGNCREISLFNEHCLKVKFEMWRILWIFSYSKSSERI